MSAVIALVLGGAAAAAQTQAVDVRDNSFAPATVTVTVGDTVTWTQSGANPHTVTAADASFDSHPACPGECMSTGDSFSQTFDSAGTVDYFCKIHRGAGMMGTVVVEAAADQSEPETEEEPDTTDETPPDEPAEEPGTGDAAPGPADDSDDTDEAVAAGEGAAEAAEDDEELADTGVPSALYPFAVVLVLGGVLAVRRGRVRGAPPQ